MSVLQTGRKLDANWTQTGRKLDADWTQTGRRLDADWKQTGNTNLKTGSEVEHEVEHEVAHDLAGDLAGEVDARRKRRMSWLAEGASSEPGGATWDFRQGSWKKQGGRSMGYQL